MRRRALTAVAVVTLSLVALWAASFTPSPVHDVPKPVPVARDAGVQVGGYDSNGYILNTNDYPVRIKQVWLFRGETTQWIRVFESGERKSQKISHQHGFHVYDMQGVEIGWVTPRKGS